MKIWTDPPATADVEALVHRYFGLLRAGSLAEAEQLIDDASMRHVLKALWKGSLGASAEADERAWNLSATGGREQDLSWLLELTLGDFHWGQAGGSFYVEVVHDSRVMEVSLGFWVKPLDTGWVLSGPSTLW
ncbi:hypothetical protein ABZX40_26640 [Streptomyces sp. NPDC004610]|uniref:hypothetical protein n=1 Tax=unclassified Streptomyces TaxID=2593676 RepID=UPI0033BB26CB